MKYLLCALICCFFSSAIAQLKASRVYSLKYISISKQESEEPYRLTSLSGFRSKHYRYSTPRLTQAAPSFAERRSSNYWTNSVTTQSYGDGKWGTLYYWDVQGNLRETKGFIDIAGKNKRGLKLVFPWR